METVELAPTITPVKELFQEFRKLAIETLKKEREVENCSSDKYPEIWKNIDKLAKPVYKDLCVMNELIEDKFNDYESPGKHCSVTHSKLCPSELKKRITSFKCIIQ